MEEATAEAERLSHSKHFEAIVRRYQGPLLRYARCSLGPDDAQDVVQETFLRLHKALRKNNLQNIVSVGRWLFKVAHNCATDTLRKRHRTSKVMDKVTGNSVDRTANTPDGLEEVVHREDCRLVLKLLGKLPPRQKQVLMLKIEGEMTYRQIGEITNQALGTVGYLINQGLGQLARELKADGVI